MDKSNTNSVNSQNGVCKKIHVLPTVSESSRNKSNVSPSGSGFAARSAPILPELDNNGTLKHFVPSTDEESDSKNTFYTLLNKISSLELADLFQSSDIVKRACKVYIDKIISDSGAFIPEEHYPLIFEALKEYEDSDYKKNRKQRTDLKTRLDKIENRVISYSNKIQNLINGNLKPARKDERIKGHKETISTLLKEVNVIKSNIETLEKESKIRPDEESFLRLYRRVIRMRYCQRLAAYEKMKNGKIHVYEKSASCGDSACFICNRAKSALLVNRMMEFCNEKDFKEKTKGWHMYMVTLTLRHDEQSNVRQGNYLAEFRNYQNKLFKRKIWTDNFKGAQLCHIENVIKEDYHIHSHNLVFAPKSNLTPDQLERQLVDEWYNITGDSHQVDLIAPGKINDENLKTHVPELMKYSTKPGIKFDQMSKEKKDRICDWFAQNVGKNMFTSYGLFKGAQITGRKSRHDNDREDYVKEFNEDSEYFIDKNGAQKANVSVHKKRDKKQRKDLFEKEGVHIVSLSGDEVNMTDKKALIRPALSDCRNLGEVKELKEMYQRDTESGLDVWSENDLEERYNRMKKQSSFNSDTIG